MMPKPYTAYTRCTSMEWKMVYFLYDHIGDIQWQPPSNLDIQLIVTYCKETFNRSYEYVA